MLLPIQQYQTILSKHVQSSEIYTSNFTDFGITNAVLEVRTPNEYITFLHLFSILTKTSQKKKFYLSKAQKKYRTMFVKESIFRSHLNPFTLNRFINFLFQSIFQDYMRQPVDDGIIIQNDKLIITFPELPFTSYNKSPIFKSIFSTTLNILNVKSHLYFNTKSLAFQF